jgi:glyoxylase-like metal-dependent hydrolase (beta-lactamase superfamily II)
MNSPPAAVESDLTAALGPWRKVRSGVYVAVAEPESVNLGLIVGTDRALLIDTGSSPAQGRAVRDSIADVTDHPLAAVVVTHWHYDHAFGLAAFSDVPRIAHESVHIRLSSADAVADARRLGVDPATSGSQPEISPSPRQSIWVIVAWRSPISAGATLTGISSSLFPTPICYLPEI